MRAWPLVAAVVIRLAAWLVVPAGRFASDEQSYFAAATAILGGHQDLFWPPVTGWLIAAARVALRTETLPVLRGLWILMDLGCLAAIYTLARRAAAEVTGAGTAASGRIASMSALAYAAYLPAISYAQFMTSETPALLLVLCVLVLLTGPSVGMPSLAIAGLLTGLLVLTRPSLLPLLALWPLAAARFNPDKVSWARASLFVVVGGLVVGGYALRNLVVAGEFTLATNSAYNLYIGNRELYAEDLNLFSPRATAGQVEFRRRQWDGTLAHPTLSAADLQREAAAWIAGHPAQFLRRAAGRLARVFVPRTDVLELVGGEAAAGVFSPASLAVLSVANVQWAFTLVAGAIGLAVLRRAATGRLFLVTIAGSVALCLVAISKPRYSFVFDPLLIVAAVVFATAPCAHWRRLGRGDRWALAFVLAFLLWGWIAWLIFAFTSRLPVVS